MIAGSPTAHGDLTQMRARSAELFACLREDGATEAERSHYRDELVRLHLPLVEHFARRFLQPRRAVRRPAPGRHHRPDQGDRPLRHRPRRGVLDVRDPDHRRRDQAALPRPRLGDPGAAPAPGAAAVDHHRDRRPDPAARPLPHRLRARRRIGVSDEEILEGLESANAYATLSLDAPDSERRQRAVDDRRDRRRRRGARARREPGDASSRCSRRSTPARSTS